MAVLLFDRCEFDTKMTVHVFHELVMHFDSTHYHDFVQTIE